MQIPKFCDHNGHRGSIRFLVLCCKEGHILQLVLEELGNPQPPFFPFYCNNSTAVGIANNMVKKTILIDGDALFLGDQCSQMKRI